MAELKKSSFSVTCNRLSQFIREKRSTLADIGTYRPPTTMNLLPGLDVSADTVTVSDRNVAEERGPLTIFYGGKVMIFDNFSSEKAEDLMNLAMRGSNMINSAKLNSCDVPMPMARRASLHRFLEKRKDRINSKAPYQMKNKTEEAKSWLGLGLES